VYLPIFRIRECNDMATEHQTDSGPSAPAGKKRRPLLIVIALFILAGGGGAAWWFLKPHAAAPANGTAAAAAAGSRAAAIYYKFDPAFVVNFGTEGNTRYLQITLEAMSREPAVIEEIKNNEPAIRNDLVLLYSSQQYETLIAPEGKEKLRQATLDAVRKVISGEGAKGEAIEGVYFTSFVIQ
jgi:flagellar protein FliL